MISATDYGRRVKVIATASGSDARWAGRVGVIARFDPTLPWRSPRALLAPEMWACVHFFPKSKREERNGSPMDLLDTSSLSPAALDE
jgi:hypothetical protein